METKKQIDWKKVWKFIRTKVFLALVIIGLILINAQQCAMIRELKRQQEIDNQNIIALNDSITYHRTKTGQLQASITSFVATEKELKELNRELYNRIKSQDGKIFSLNYTIVQLRQDSATLAFYLVEKEKLIERLQQVDEDTYAAPWTLTYRYDSLNFDVFSGRTYIQVSAKDSLELFHVDTEMINRLTQIDLTWGQKVEDNKLRIFMQSAYPGFTVAQMQGVLIDPNTNPYIQRLIKKKHWFTGWSVGLGATGGFDITTGKYGLVVGPTIQFSIYQW